MSKVKISNFDIAEHLRTEEEMSAYLDACIEDSNNDAAFISKALGDIAKAKGMSRIAEETGLSRESLYKSLSGERIPSLDTFIKVIKALNLKITTKPNLA
ncbi:MAG: putative addiction module antidote protein [Planctomycetes bacterium]|nr:putative addiction module antidote protein [Planctomycetota bacterium]